MARAKAGEPTRLRRVVSEYARQLVKNALGAQSLAYSGGSLLAVYRLVASGAELAGRLQRAVVVRVAGAPLVRRAPRRGRGRASDDLESAPPGQAVDASLDQAATEWEEPVPYSLALAEAEGTHFALARALHSLAAAQQSALKAVFPFASAAAGVASRARFGGEGARSAPSGGSRAQDGRARPDSLPMDQGTGFDARPLALTAALGVAGSALVFQLQRAVDEKTSLALGSHAVGTAFSPPSRRSAGAGTEFTGGSPAPTAPSLLQPSIAGRPETSFSAAAPPSLGLPSPAPGRAPSTVAFALTREAAAGTPSGLETPELGAGPYAVPNGFDSVFSTPAFAAGRTLSTAVSNLAAPAPGADLPLRPSREAAPPPGAGEGLPLVPEQYPSSYPAGEAYAVSSLSASLGIGRRLEAREGGSTGAVPALSAGEAPGIEDAVQKSGGALLGGDLGPQPGVPGAAPVTHLLDEGPSPPEASLGAEPGVEPPRPAMGAAAPAHVPERAGPVLGDGWLASVAAVAGIGAAVLALLTASSHARGAGSHIQAALTPGTSALEGSRAPPRTDPGLPVSSPVAPGAGFVLSSSPERSSPAFPGLEHDGEPGRAQAGLPDPSTRPPAQGPPVGGRPAARGAPSAPPWDTTPALPLARSVWESVTLLPGILTPPSSWASAPGLGAAGSPRVPTAGAMAVAPGAGESDRPADRATGAFEPPGLSSRSAPLASPAEVRRLPRSPGVGPGPSGSPPLEAGAGGTAVPADEADAVQTASSVRDLLLSSSSELIGASGSTVPGGSSLVAGPQPRLSLGERAPASKPGAGPHPSPGRRAAPADARRIQTEPEPGGVEMPGQSFAASGVDGVKGTGPTEEPREGEPGGRSGAGRALPRAAVEGVSPRIGSEASGLPAVAGGKTPPGVGGIPGEPRGHGEEPPSGIPNLGAGRAWSPLESAYLPALVAALSSRVAPPSMSRVPPTALPLPERTGGDGAPPAQGQSSLSRVQDGGEAHGLARPSRRVEEPGLEGAFEGLESVAEALAVVAALPTTARLDATVSPPARGAMAQTKQGVARQAPKLTGADEPMEPRPGSRLLEGWKSAPEEAVARVLAEAPGQGQQRRGAEAPEPDDRELRRKIEKLVEEDLRRHGYQP